MINKKTWLILLIILRSSFASDQNIKKTWGKIAKEFEPPCVDQKVVRDFARIATELEPVSEVGFMPVEKKSTKQGLSNHFDWEIVD